MVKPRPRQSARKNPDTAREHESMEALSAPSLKEALVNDDNEMHGTSGNTESTNEPEIQPEGSATRDVPASTPSVVAGSPPTRRPVQRLKSALPRNSLNPASDSNAANGSDLRPNSLKFKPKSFIRRSKEEREAEEKAVAERRAARQAAERTSSTSDRGGYYGRARGRGPRGGFGDMNRWKNERFNLSREASGHLGGATIQDAATSKNRRGGGFRSGISGPSESASINGTSCAKEPTVKPEKDRDGDVVMRSSTSKPKRTKVKKEDQGPTYISSEGELDSDGGERVNIEDISTINLVSSEDEEDDSAQQSQMSKGERRDATLRVTGSHLMPVRIQRQEHVERAVGVNTDASSLTSAELRRRAQNRAEAGGSLFLPEVDEPDVLSATKPKIKRKPRDVEFVRNERKWKGVYQDEDDEEGMVRIKDEPNDDRDVVMIDKPPGDEEAVPISLENIANTITQRTEKDRNGTLTPGASLQDLSEAPEADPLLQPGEKLRRIKGYHGLRPVQMSEEEEEDDIFAEIAEIVLLKSGVPMDTSSLELPPSTKVINDDDDLDMVREDSYFQKAGKEEVYLFQLPPVVPSLRDVSKVTSKSEDKKKTKAVPVEAPTSSAPNHPFAAQVKDEPNIKPDPDAFIHETAVPYAYTSDSFHAIGGRGGVLSIHAKGSMLATWGGMSFEIRKEGTGAELAQELMMTEFEIAVTKVEDESRWEEKVDVGRKGWAMGQMHPGHVCIPEISDLLL